MQKHRLFPFPNSSVYHCLTQQDLTHKHTHTHGTEIPNVIISYLMITAHQQRLHPFITSAAGAPPPGSGDILSQRRPLHGPNWTLLTKQKCTGCCDYSTNCKDGGRVTYIYICTFNPSQAYDIKASVVYSGKIKQGKWSWGQLRFWKDQRKIGNVSYLEEGCVYMCLN